jgi:hypothetical protein
LIHRIVRSGHRLNNALTALYLGARDGLELWSKFGALGDDDRAKARLVHRRQAPKNDPANAAD